MIERVAEERGHEVVLTVDVENRDSILPEQLKQADVAIEFTVPDAAVVNCEWCFDCGVPVVSGTTGWMDCWQEVVNYCQAKDGALFYASNYSIGVNLFFRLNEKLARMMSGFDDYKVYLEETHHIHKIDKPSGTAIAIAEGILENHPAYKSWELEHGVALPSDVIPVTARRIGEVPGIHAVTYKSDVDEIEIRHSALSREGFARGAVLAAEFLKEKKGVYGMRDMLKNL